MTSQIYKAGSRLKSAVCQTQLMVLRIPAEALDLRCGGAPMLAMDATADGASLDPALSGGTQTGKRYVDEAESMELLCTKGGEGTITVNGVALDIKQAKKLPSSD